MKEGISVTHLNIPVGISDFAEIRRTDIIMSIRQALCRGIKSSGSKSDTDYPSKEIRKDIGDEYSGKFL